MEVKVRKIKLIKRDEQNQEMKQFGECFNLPVSDS